MIGSTIEQIDEEDRWITEEPEQHCKFVCVNYRTTDSMIFLFL